MLLRSFLVASLCCAVVFGQSQYSWDNLPKAAVPTFKKDTFNIKKFGAIADGLTLNTKSINAAIDACNKNGGGVVLVPEGVWITGPIELKSNVNLSLSRNAVLDFTRDFNQYLLVKTNWEGLETYRNQSPISGTNLVNVAITGKGVVDGNGDIWRAVGRNRLTESDWKHQVASGGMLSEDGKTWYPSPQSEKGEKLYKSGELKKLSSQADFESIKDFLRPNLLVLTRCKKVLLEGVIFQNSPAWCVHPLMCEDVTIRNVTVKNPEYAHNGDALDLESCKNVLVEGCTLDAGDDGICIKSGRDEQGRKRGMPTENVVVRNCYVYRAHGGFVIGSEMSGGAKNIFAYNLTFMGTDKGLRFKTARGRGGMVENIYCKNIYMKDIIDEAIYFDMYYFTKSPKPGEKVEAPKVTEATPQFQNFYISNIVCDGAAKGIFVRGLPEMSIKNIHISDVSIRADKGVELFEAENLDLKNITVATKELNPIVYIENCNGLQLQNFKNVNMAKVLFSINGERNKQLVVTKTDVSNAEQKVVFAPGVSESVLQIK